MFALSMGSAQAALIDRGDGLLYDDVLDITWLQDANYAATSGYAAGGLMTWSDANTWAANLVFAGYDDWRLASSTDTGAPGCDASNSGTDCGFNSSGSEMAHMYYNNLGLKGTFSPTGVFQPDCGIFGDGTEGGQNNVGLVINLQSNYYYWSGTAYPTNPDLADSAWVFGAFDGDQFYDDKSFEY